MSSNTGSMGYQDWPTREGDYWQTTKTARGREDARLVHEHASGQDQLDRSLAELYNRRSHLQDALKEVDANIEFQKAEKQRLSQEYERKRAILHSQRQDEDRSQQGWSAGAQEDVIPGKGSTIPTTTSGPSSHDRILPNPAASWPSINPPRRRSSRVQEQQKQEKRSDPGNLFGSVFHNPVDEGVVSISRALPLRNTTTPLPPPGTSFKLSPLAYTQPAPGHLPQHERHGLAKPQQERRTLPPFAMGNGK
jgi:hypothetical protein